MGQLDLLDLPPSIIERIALVRLDTPDATATLGEHGGVGSKRFAFWPLRAVCHPGLSAAAWNSRHYVLKPSAENVARFGDTEWCRILLVGEEETEEGGTRVVDGALVEAADKGHAETTRMLLENGANVHYLDDLCLRWAAEEGHLGVVEVLLKGGADVNAEDGEALCAAVTEGHTGVVQLLLEHGADANARGGYALPFVSDMLESRVPS